MRYKIILALLLIISIAVFMFSCSGNPSGETSEIQSETESETTAHQSPGLIYKVSLKNESKVEGEKEIHSIYPEISGYPDAELEKKANGLLRSFVDSKAAYYTSGIDSITYKMESVEPLAKNDRIFSAVCRVSVISADSAYPMNMCFGLSLDLKNARMLSFTDVFDYELFKKSFENGDFKLISGYEELMSEMTYSDIISAYNPLYSIYPDFYIRSEDGAFKAGIIYETIHVLGDYAVFEDQNSNAPYFVIDSLISK